MKQKELVLKILTGTLKQQVAFIADRLEKFVIFIG